MSVNCHERTNCYYLSNQNYKHSPIHLPFSKYLLRAWVKHINNRSQRHIGKLWLCYENTAAQFQSVCYDLQKYLGHNFWVHINLALLSVQRSSLQNFWICFCYSRSKSFSPLLVCSHLIGIFISGFYPQIQDTLDGEFSVGNPVWPRL